MSFFGVSSLGGNPFSTPVGQKIELATEGSLASENWSLNMEICDLVNESDEARRDALKAIRKRLQQNAGKNYTIVMYTLTVLETCVKNCGRRFHLLACNKDFVQELVKLIGPKNDPPTVVQEKVLSLIQSWADAFRHVPELSGVVNVYQDLLAKGIEFPATDLDAMAPIHTPERSVSETIEAPLDALLTAPPVSATLSPDQRQKLQNELTVVQGNASVLSEMLSEINPGAETPADLALINELNLVCHEMQRRLRDLIPKLSQDDLTEELLRINDFLNIVFLRYSRWEKNRAQPSASALLAKAVPPPPGKKSDEDMIDLEENAIAGKFENLEIGAKKGETDEFDMFAQSRNATYETSKLGSSSYKDNLDPDQISVGLSAAAAARGKTSEDREFDEMAAWLQETR